MSLRTILVGVDESEGSRAALEWAAVLAEQVRARVVLVHAFEPLAHLAELGPERDFAALRRLAQAQLSGSLCEPLRARGLTHSTRLAEGEPAEVLVRAAEEEDADLVVVGARRQGRLKGLLLGSTSARLAQLTPRPVTIVHAPLADAPR